RRGACLGEQRRPFLRSLSLCVAPGDAPKPPCHPIEPTASQHFGIGGSGTAERSHVTDPKIVLEPPVRCLGRLEGSFPINFVHQSRREKGRGKVRRASMKPPAGGVAVQ